MEKNKKSKKNRTANQIFWYAAANYIAFILGFLAYVFIYPIDLEFLGKIKFIETIGHLIYPFLLFGLAQSFVNFNPLLEKYHAKTFFGNSILFIAFLSCIALLLLNILNNIFHLTDFNYYFLGIALAIALAFIELIKSRAVTLERVTVPVLLEKILPKLFLPLLFFFLYRKIVSVNDLLAGFSYTHFIIVVLMLLYVLQFSLPRFSLKPEYLFENFTKNELVKFCVFSLLGSFGSLLAFRIDSFMIPHYLGFNNNGLFSVAMMFASLIAIPSTAFFAINAPIVSDLIKKNLFRELSVRYRETAKILFFRGGLLFSCIYIITPDFLAGFVNDYHKFDDIIPVINLLGLSALINIGTGFNNEIILYSKYYKFNIVNIFALAVLNIILNFYFLNFTNLGLMGVAIASTISLVAFNISKLLFIYIKFDMLPFDIKYLHLIILMFAVIGCVAFLPRTELYWVNILYKSSIIVILNSIIVYYFDLIPSHTAFIKKIITKYL
jgi:O-antigen/teichoic acid export membrane protein